MGGREKVFTKNDGLKQSGVIIFHTLGYREIDKLEYSGREKREGTISEWDEKKKGSFGYKEL